MRQSWQNRQPLTWAILQAGGLELAQAERGVVVDRLGELRGGRTDARDHHAPDVDDRVLALGDVDSHGFLCFPGLGVHVEK